MFNSTSNTWVSQSMIKVVPYSNLTMQWVYTIGDSNIGTYQMKYYYINSFKKLNSNRERFARPFTFKVCGCVGGWDGGITSFNVDYFVGSK